MARVGYVDHARGFELIRNFCRKGCSERFGPRAEHYQQRNFAMENSREPVEIGGGFVQLRFNFGCALEFASAVARRPRRELAVLEQDISAPGAVRRLVREVR